MNSFVKIIGNGLFAASAAIATNCIAQTCNDNAPRTAPDSRFVVNADGTVTDQLTGLIWKQCHEGRSTTSTPCDSGSDMQFTWQGAFSRASFVNAQGFAGSSQWRVPNIKELASITERGCFDPAINETIFPRMPSLNNSRFWSSTPDSNRFNSGIGANDYAWIVRFYGGATIAGTTYGDSKNLTVPITYLRLVRDPN